MPVLCFFNALYYTDTGSLFYVLLTYYNTLTDSPLAAGLTGLVAVLFRQVPCMQSHFVYYVLRFTADEHCLGWRVCGVDAVPPDTRANRRHRQEG